MPTIRPISDLRNKSELVVMSHAPYENQQARIELYQKLAIAESQSNVGVDRKRHANVMSNLRSLIRIEGI